MADKKSSVETRKFFRFEIEEPIHYEMVFFTEDKIISSRTADAISKNLSAFGILFATKQPPNLSSTVFLRLDFSKIPNHKQIKEQIFMVEDKVLGKVVRIEDGGDEYNVGVAFVAKSEKLTEEIRNSITKVRKRQWINYFIRLVSVVFIILTTVTINLIYLQRKDTYRPDKDISLTPDSIHVSYEEVNFKSLNDAETINGWFVAASHAKATILFCHGRTGNMSNELDTTVFFHSMGMNFFMFDYRGYGKSSGRPNEKGLYRDAQAAYDYLVSRKDVNKQEIIVIGESLGGAVAADLCLHRVVKALVLESTFVSLIEEARDLYPFLPVQYLLLEKYDTLSIVKHLHIPKLIVHGVDDEVISFKHAGMLYDAASFPKQFLPFEGGHNDGVFKTSEAYKSELNKFFLKNKILQQ